MLSKRTIKKILGDLPYTAELYWRFVMHGRPLTKSISMKRLERSLPDWRTQLLETKRKPAGGKAAEKHKRILMFATLRYWIEHATVMGMALAGMGHNVTLAYLPYPNFRKRFNPWDARRQNAYARSVLELAHPAIRTVSLMDVRPAGGRSITPALFHEVQQVAIRDTQYALQIEKVDTDGDSPSAHMYHLRLDRDLQAAAAVLGLVQSMPPAERPEVVLTPNGSILEMGAVYQAARALDLPIVTYEFGEQRDRIWFAQNDEVMHQETGPLWDSRKEQRLSDEQWEQVRELYASRQGGRLWENFSRQWQGQPSQGGAQARQALGLDERPVVLLAANVIGDSLTLGRQAFSRDMTEWLERSVQHFARRPDVQLVVRIHPGERYLKGPSVAEVVRQALPELPEHICLVQAQDPVNTYDLVEIADLGLVYTTTVGMEMAMYGVPAIVGGKTHYRGKGFTHDPDSWESYFQMIDDRLASPPQRLSREQVEAAWQYAYHFFFDYPTAFPWHLLDLWGDVEKWPLERVLSDEGREKFNDTFRWLTGEPRQW